VERGGPAVRDAGGGGGEVGARLVAFGLLAGVDADQVVQAVANLAGVVEGGGVDEGRVDGGLDDGLGAAGVGVRRVRDGPGAGSGSRRGRGGRAGGSRSGRRVRGSTRSARWWRGSAGRRPRAR